MDVLRIGLAIGLPWLAGVVWLRCLWREAPEGGWPMALGYGYVVGMLGTTLVMRALDTAGLSLAFGPTALALAGLLAAGLWLSRKAPWTARGGGNLTASWRGQARWEKAVFLALVAVLALRLAGLGLEAVSSPLFSWDAWATWTPKARVWYELRRLVPFVDWDDWLRMRFSGAYTISASHYPPTIPLLQTWICLALGRWDDSLVSLPWLGCAVALGFAFYGQARLWGVRPLTGMTFTYLLLSLPLLGSQVALAGNADLWMATVYGLAALSFFHWLRSGDRRQGLLALGMAGACALIKVPGLAWMLTFVPALVLPRLSRVALLAVVGLPCLLLGVLLAAGGVTLRLPGVGDVGITPEAIDLPYLGHYPVALRPEVWRAFYESNFSLASWHLLWYLWWGLVLLRWRFFVADRHSSSMAVLSLAGLVFVGGIYSFSRLAEFAVDFTQLNRTTLHMVPMLLFVALAAWRGSGDDPAAPRSSG